MVSLEREDSLIGKSESHGGVCIRGAIFVGGKSQGSQDLAPEGIAVGWFVVQSISGTELQRA